MKFKVLIPQLIAEEGIRYLTDRGYEVIVGTGDSIDHEVLRRELAEADAVLIRTVEMNAEVLSESHKLKVISKHGIGVDNIDLKQAEEYGIFVTNAAISNAGTVAEYTIGMIIALARNLSRSVNALRKGDFKIRNRMLGQDLAGKTLGIIGLGRIGKKVAHKACAALEMNIIGYDPIAAIDHEFSFIEQKEKIEDVFRNADFISLHVPFTPSTYHFVGQRELSWMRPGAFLINASRGELVDEQQLIKALNEGVIAGAGIDVFETEPPNNENPLLHMDNVIATPHNAALTKEAVVRMAVQAAMGIDEVLSGKQPSWPVVIPSIPRAFMGRKAAE